MRIGFDTSFQLFIKLSVVEWKPVHLSPLQQLFLPFMSIRMWPKLIFKKWQDQRTGTLWDLCRSSREGARTAKSDASHQWKVWQNEFCGRRAREATVKIMPFMYSRRQAMYSFSGGWRHRSRISLSSQKPYNLNRLKGKRKTDFGSESIGTNLLLL